MRKRNATNSTIYQFIKENFTLLIFSMVLFIMGVVFGSFLIHTLSINQKQELISYISSFLYDVNNNQLQNTNISLSHVFLNDAKYLFFIWFLGLSVIGMPLIFLILFFKGVIIGFTIAFLVSEMSWRGFLFALVSIVPQNMIAVPVFIIAAVIGTLFSLSLIKSRAKKLTAYQQSFTSYSMSMLVLIGFIALSSLIETFISPSFVKLFVRIFT